MFFRHTQTRTTKRKINRMQTIARTIRILDLIRQRIVTERLVVRERVKVPGRSYLVHLAAMRRKSLATQKPFRPISILDTIANPIRRRKPVWHVSKGARLYRVPISLAMHRQTAVVVVVEDILVTMRLMCRICVTMLGKASRVLPENYPILLVMLRATFRIVMQVSKGKCQYILLCVNSSFAFAAFLMVLHCKRACDHARCASALIVKEVLIASVSFSIA